MPPFQTDTTFLFIMARPAEAPFADPATGTPIQGKPPGQGQASLVDSETGVSKLLDPASIEDIFERQDSRMPDLRVEGQPATSTPKQ